MTTDRDAEPVESPLDDDQKKFIDYLSGMAMGDLVDQLETWVTEFANLTGEFKAHREALNRAQIDYEKAMKAHRRTGWYIDTVYHAVIEKGNS